MFTAGTVGRVRKKGAPRRLHAGTSPGLPGATYTAEVGRPLVLERPVEHGEERRAVLDARGLVRYRVDASPAILR